MENYNEAEVQGKIENGDLLSLDVDAYEQDDFEERFINKIDAALNKAEHKLQRDILENEVEENLSKLRYSHVFENPLYIPYSIVFRLVFINYFTSPLLYDFLKKLGFLCFWFFKI